RDRRAAPGQRVDRGREQQHQAGDDVDHGGRLLEQPEPVDDDRDDQATDHGVATRPLPPNSEVPPMTAEPTAYSSVFTPPDCGLTEPTFDAITMPPMADTAEPITNTLARIFGTSIPARRAASRFPPTA